MEHIQIGLFSKGNHIHENTYISTSAIVHLFEVLELGILISEWTVFCKTMQSRICKMHKISHLTFISKFHYKMDS